MNTDLVQGELQSEQEQAILKAIEDIKAQLPFLVVLNAADRRALPKMGDKSRAFVDHALVLAKQNEGILPRNFDLSGFSRDVSLVRDMESVVSAIRQLASSIEDTFLAAGSDAYTQALIVYQTAKLAGKDGSLSQHLDSLSKRFARKPSSSEPAAPNAVLAATH